VFRCLLTAERITFYSIAFAVSLYLLTGTAFRQPLKLYFERIETGLCLYLVMLAVALLFVRLGQIRASRGERVPVAQTLSEYRRRYWSKHAIALDLRYINVVALVFTCFLHLKHLIPIIHPALFDRQLELLERSWFGGLIATEWLIEFLGAEQAAFWSGVYDSFYYYIALVIFIFIGVRDRALRDSFFTYFALTWGLGILMVYSYPTYGPCFVLPEVLSVLPETRVTELQAGLFTLQEFTLANPQDPRGLFMISGYPSIHLALPLGASWYLWRLHPALGSLSLLFSLLTAVATVYFGWHWVVDDFGSLVLAGLSVLLAKRLTT